MKDHMEHVRQLRASEDPHYNCCQAVMVPFAREMGINEQQAFDIGAHFGGGMKMGATCGAVAGALMVLGSLGFEPQEASGMLRDFRQEHGSTNCADLLKASKERGEVKKDHCDALVYEMVEFLDRLTMKP